MTNIQLNNVNKTIKELELDYRFQFDTDLDICVDTLDENVTLIRVFVMTSIFESYELKIPKVKAFTSEYVLERIAKKQKVEYINYSDLFSKLLNTLEFPKSPYANSYGLGIDAFNKTRVEDFSDMYAVGSVLEANGIEFTYGCSEAEYVRRVLISKKKSNIEKIEKLCM